MDRMMWKKLLTKDAVRLAYKKFKTLPKYKGPLIILAVISSLLFIILIITLIKSFNTQGPLVEISLDSFTDLAHQKKFFHHAEDMQRLRTSITKELGQLEQRRTELLDSVNSLNKVLAEGEGQLRETKRDLSQMRSDVDQMKVYRDEINKYYSPANLPLGIPLLPDNSIFDVPKHACQLDSCFDYSRCSVLSGFPVYVYPLPGDVTNLKLLAWRDALSKSTYLTNAPDSACIYVYLYSGSFDPAHLPYWKGDGRNHVIINVLTNQLVALQTRAMHAQIKFGNERPVQNFDVGLPHFTLPFVTVTILPMLLPVRRANLLLFNGAAPNVDSHRQFVEGISLLHDSKLAIIVNVSCVAEAGCVDSWWCLCQQRGMSDLKNTTFVLVPNDAYMPFDQLAYRLYFALRSGVIPVVLGSHHQLPMEEFIPWSQAVVKLPFQRVAEVPFIIRNILEPDIMELKKQGRSLFEDHLMSVTKVANTLLDLLRTRIHIPPQAVPTPESYPIYSKKFPMKMSDTLMQPTEKLGPIEAPYSSPSYQRNFTSWHGSVMQWSRRSHLFPYTPWDPILPTDAKFHGSSFGFRPINGGVGGTGNELNNALGGNNLREQFTIVILAYKRSDALKRQLAQLNNLPYLHKVLVIWNPLLRPNSTLEWPRLTSPIEVIKSFKNSLNNRFLPYKEIETEAVLSLDDDIFLNHEEIIFSFRAWRENRDRIVGLPGSYHAWNENDKEMKFNSSYSCQLSLVLTGAAFFHKYYMYQYSYIMPQAIRDKVDEFTNCEDIAMNFLVSHITGKPPVKTTQHWDFQCGSCGRQPLSADPSYLGERHECIRFFTQVYGYLPLLYTQMRADSILQKMNLPLGSTKCFPSV